MGDNKSYKHDQSYKEFEKLCNSIDETVSKMSEVVGKTFGKGGENIGSAISQAVGKGLDGAQKAVKKGMATYGKPSPNQRVDINSAGSNQNFSIQRSKQFKSSVGLKVSGWVMAVLGGIYCFGFLMAALMVFFAPAMIVDGTDGSLPLAITGFSSLVLACLCGWLLIAGINRITLGGRLDSLKRIMCNRDVCSLAEISSQLHVAPDKALSSIRALIKKGLIPEGHLDDDQTCLMTSNDAYRLYRQTMQQYKARMTQKQAEEASKLKAQREAQAITDSLPPKASKFIQDGLEYMNQIRSLDVAIDDVLVSEKIVSIESVISQILERVKDAPDVVDRLDNMSNYYLPTTIKLLKAYDELEDQPVQGKNVVDSRKEIEHTLDVLHGAYSKLLDETFFDMTLDVSADISVLHTVLAQDGLSQSPFDEKDDKSVL